jgi:DNA-binding NarL/FixJ family response regulator
MVMQSSHGGSEPSCRVLIADDHAVVRQGLRTILSAQSQFEVCAEASTGIEAIEKARLTKPNVALLDIAMPEMNGLEATRALRRMPQRPEVLLLTYYESEALMIEALRAGAHGYVLKTELGTDLVTALECVSSHCPFFNSQVWKLVLDGYQRFLDQPPGRGPGLNQQELRVVRLLADGRTNKEIAEAECVGLKAAERIRIAIMKKLHLRSLSDIVHYAVRNNLVAV